MGHLKYAPWSSDIELAFYPTLASLKVNHDKLNDAARKLVGRYELRPHDSPERSARMQVHGNAFTINELPLGQYRAEGIMKNVNTIEEYKNIDRTVLMEQAGRTIWDAIHDGTIYSCPSLLSSFYVIFFADLKKYRFTYHFAFPALHSSPSWILSDTSAQQPARLSATESSLLFDAVQTWRYGVDNRQHGFFLAKRMQLDDSMADNGNASRSWAVAGLASYRADFFKHIPLFDRFICFVDPSNYPENPAWMLRNLLVLVRQQWQLDQVRILCYRDTHARREEAHSIILDLISSSNDEPVAGPRDDCTRVQRLPKITGWERNDHNKLNNKVVDLGEYMDPRKLADQSVDLNLKLMKWRIAPELDLDIVKNTKCLLLGAGTLGSYVARNLMGWGVRKITFVDYGKVSFSNPVRQPLFNFQDCLGGGVPKAARAAEALREIYPGVESEGHAISVPMAGHPLLDEAKVEQDYNTLCRLIGEHDVVMLLMDTRESRWLPTVLGRSMKKIVMNAALGFDSYLVMRHGFETAGSGISQMLGCYFCNDVVVPANSIKDQTLDQQCTVTRPGVAAIASALLVELLVSLLQHPLRAAAPAPSSRAATPEPLHHPLGLIPHQIRGVMGTFDNLLLHGPAFDCCSACSPAVIKAYEREGWDFVKRALGEAGFVERVSGLAAIQKKALEAEADIDWDDEDEAASSTLQIVDDDGELI